MMEEIWLLLFEQHVLLVESRYLFEHHLAARNKAPPQKLVDAATRKLGFLKLESLLLAVHNFILLFWRLYDHGFDGGCAKA